jgi:signal transduction histidine kinase
VALHDIKSIIGTILHTAENAISLQVGGSFDEKIESAPEYLRTIYHACRVLESLLQFTDIVANPESAFFGNAIRRRLHALLKLLVRVFEAKAAERDITILLRGSSYNQPLVLSSFIVIPVVLIDNAIKHSDNGSQVVVNVQDLNAWWRTDRVQVERNIGSRR